MDIVVILLLVIILGCLAFGAYYLQKDKSDSKRTLNALRLRVGFSIVLIIVLVGGHYSGCIKENNIVNLSQPDNTAIKV